MLCKCPTKFLIPLVHRMKVFPNGSVLHGPPDNGYVPRIEQMVMAAPRGALFCDVYHSTPGLKTPHTIYTDVRKYATYTYS